MNRKRVVSIILAVAMAVFFTGISFAGTLSEIIKRGELRVAVQSGAPPYAFIDKTGVPAGSMVDFTKGMADAMGVKIKVLDFDWDGLIPALLSGKADILAADMTPTLKRALKISFTDPWIEVQPCVFTTQNASFKTLEDVNKSEVTVGVLLGSTGETIAKKYLPNVKIKSYKGGGRMIVQALVAGHVDAGVNDDLAVLTVLPDFPPNSVRLLDKRLGQGKDPLAFAVRQDSDNLRQWINLYFKTVRANGDYDTNIAYWLEGFEWKKDH